MTMSIFSGQIISRTGRYKIWPIIGIVADDRRVVAAVAGSGVDTPFWLTAVFMAIFGSASAATCSR